MTIRAPAKINLYLEVLGKRKDGYHNIETVFERISLSDKIVLRSLKNDKIKIFSDNPHVPIDKTSLMYKTINLLKKRFKIQRGVELKIFKRIPVASGLGGGSSDAAAVLAGLNKLWKLSLDLSELAGIGRKLGADVPFFLNKNSFALAKGRGDKIMPLGWKAKFWHLLVFSPVRLLSKDIYNLYTKKFSSRLTKRPRLTKILSPSAKAIKVKDINGFVANDLEQIVLKKAPIVARLKKVLKSMGFSYSLVSGSGPGVFSLFEKRKEAVRARGLLIERFPIVKGKGWQIFIAQTL